MAQKLLPTSGSLLLPNGRPAHAGWSPQPSLDCNLEATRFYPLRFLQRWRIKRWDYYAVFTPQRFFSATIADLGYAGNLFVYTLDFKTGELHEEGVVIPLARGVSLPRNSTSGESSFADKRLKMFFRVEPEARCLSIDWPAFHNARGIHADLRLACPPDHESMNIVIPIGDRRFYYNRKINCMPATGRIDYGPVSETLAPHTCLGSLDWGRGVWEYQSYWNWASASGFLPNGDTLGLNLGQGFGDLSHASENCAVLNGCIHKLESVKWEYAGLHASVTDYMAPWRFTSDDGRLQLEFTPFKERIARTNLGIITSEVHQMFGRYNGRLVTDEGAPVEIRDLIGFAEEHQARW